MEVPVNIKTKELVGYSKEGENCYRCVLDTNQVIWITESGHSIHPSEIIKFGDVHLQEVWYETLRRNKHIKPIPIPMVKKPKAATIKAARKHRKEISTEEFLDFLDSIWKAGGKKKIDGITWKITIE